MLGCALLRDNRSRSSSARVLGKAGRLGPVLLAGTGACYIVVFLLIPLVLTAVLSLSTKNYYYIVTTGLYGNVLVKSLVVGAEVSVLDLIIGYPAAYYLAKLTTVRHETVVVLLLFPFFTSFLIRTYSWLYILGTNGFVNTLLMAIGLIHSPIHFLFNEGAVVFGLVNCTVAFMIMPIYLSVDKVNDHLIEMSKSLGANDLSTFRQITFPLSVPGIASGVILTFITSFGAYITPSILGGPGDAMIANLVGMLFLKMFDWPSGTALSVIVVLVTLSVLYVYNKLIGLDKLSEALG